MKAPTTRKAIATPFRGEPWTEGIIRGIGDRGSGIKSFGSLIPIPDPRSLAYNPAYAESRAELRTRGHRCRRRRRGMLANHGTDGKRCRARGDVQRRHRSHPLRQLRELPSSNRRRCVAEAFGEGGLLRRSALRGWCAVQRARLRLRFVATRARSRQPCSAARCRRGCPSPDTASLPANGGSVMSRSRSSRSGSRAARPREIRPTRQNRRRFPADGNLAPPIWC